MCIGFAMLESKHDFLRKKIMFNSLYVNEFKHKPLQIKLFISDQII